MNRRYGFILDLFRPPDRRSGSSGALTTQRRDNHSIRRIVEGIPDVEVDLS